MANQLKPGDIVTIVNIEGLYSSFEDLLGKTGIIVELEPYFPPPIKVKFPTRSTFAFYEQNVRFATPQEIARYNSELTVDPWKEV